MFQALLEIKDNVKWKHREKGQANTTFTDQQVDELLAAEVYFTDDPAWNTKPHGNKKLIVYIRDNVDSDLKHLTDWITKHSFDWKVLAAHRCYRNEYGEPAIEVYKKLDTTKIKNYMKDLPGATEFELGKFAGCLAFETE